MSAEFVVRVIPRSSRQKVELQPDRVLKVWLHAAPTDGQANRALCEFLAKSAGVAPSAVAIVSGAGTRTKRVRIEGIELPALWERLS